MYIREGIKYQVCTGTPSNTIAVLLIDYNIHIVVVYRPPSYPATENNALIEFMSEFCNNKETVVMGDFNLPSIDWSQEYAVQGILNTDLAFLNCFTMLGLT